MTCPRALLAEPVLGVLVLVTLFPRDGLDRRVAVTAPKEVGDPKEIITRTGFDLVGRRTQVTENEGGGALERVTTFAYNRLSQLITRTAGNKDSTGLPLADQVTTYRSDSLGRQTRIVYPDAPSGDHANPDTCTDCVKAVYDLAGRMTQRQDQRNTTVYAYDRRGLPRTRTTGATVDMFDQDALGRTILADRGTSGNPAATSHAAMAYNAVPPGTNDLGDLLSETQAIQGGTASTVAYTYDQAGNRLSLAYPGGTVLAYAPTALNQVDTVKVGGNPLVDYAYAGRRLQGRTTTTSALGGTATYQQDWGYDSHRRVNAITNSVDTGGGPQTVADYAFTHDAVGNPLSRSTVTGLLDFLGDDRLFGVDDLNRLVGTDYLGSGEAESTSFDLVGNREAHRNRKGETTDYGVVNPANEFPWIGDVGHAVSYDATGNLTVDEEGRRYSYDEQNRLTEVKEPLPATGTLARYTYDAVGRRIVFEDPIGGTTTRYYYDGVNAIEECDAADVLMRYHVHGAQYIDERVGTYDTGVGGLRAPGWSYYLLNDNFSVAGTGDGAGTIARLDYSATGDPTGAGAGYYFDADNNVTIDLIDWASLAGCLLGPDVPTGAGCGVHDFTRDGRVDLADAVVFQRYFNQSGATALRPLSRSGNYAYDWDSDRDVDLVDYVWFNECWQGSLSSPVDPTCLAVFDFDDAGQSDGIIDMGDAQGFTYCYSGEGQTPPTDCFRPGPGGSAPTSGMFALHGQPVDVLADPDGPTGPQTPLALQYSRARYFDLKHGRWLQRDPLGFVDGSNLYEAYRSNPTRFTDPRGKWSKLASGWSDGDEVLWQRQWPMLGKQDEFSVGTYRYVNGEKFIVYDQDIEGRGYRYVLSLRHVQQWAKHTEVTTSNYERFVRLNAVPIDRLTGAVVDRPLGEALGMTFEGMMGDEYDRLERLISGYEPMTFVAGPAMMALTGEDIGAGVTVPGRFRVLGAVLTAAELAPAARLVFPAAGTVRVAGPSIVRLTRVPGAGEQLLFSFAGPSPTPVLSGGRIVVSRGSHVLDLSGTWRQVAFADEGLVYLLRDATSGEILKVGQTTAQTFAGRFKAYMAAAGRTGRRLQIEVFEVPLGQRGVVEGQIRQQLGTTPGSLPWDNTGGRLGRPGSGLP